MAPLRTISHYQRPTVQEAVLSQAAQAVNKDKFMSNEADRLDGLPGYKLLIVSKCQMRNEMIRRLEPILQHLDAKQFVEFENRSIIGEKHKRAVRRPASGRRATGKTTDMAKCDLKGG